MKTKSIKGQSPEEIKTALQGCMADGFKPTIAIDFISFNQAKTSACEILHNEGIDILGANGRDVDDDVTFLVIKVTG